MVQEGSDGLRKGRIGEGLFGLACLAIWIAIFSVGILVPSGQYREALARTMELQTLVLAAVTRTRTWRCLPASPDDAGPIRSACGSLVCNRLRGRLRSDRIRQHLVLDAYGTEAKESIGAMRPMLGTPARPGGSPCNRRT